MIDYLPSPPPLVYFVQCPIISGSVAVDPSTHWRAMTMKLGSVHAAFALTPFLLIRKDRHVAWDTKRMSIDSGQSTDGVIKVTELSSALKLARAPLRKMKQIANLLSLREENQIFTNTGEHAPGHPIRCPSDHRKWYLRKADFQKWCLS